MSKITIAILCFNEEENIKAMYEAVTEQMKKRPSYDYEIIFADNDSQDRSGVILREIAKKDRRAKVVFNRYNVGPERSAVNLLTHCSGDAVIFIPCDFQEPPEMIPELIDEWAAGNEVVLGQKISSKENAVKYLLRGIYYGIIQFFSEYRQLRQVTGFGIIDWNVWKSFIPLMQQDYSLNVRHLLPKYGYRVKLIPYEQQKRRAGKSSYNMSRYFDFALRSLINTSVKPLRLMTILGLFTAVMSVLVGVIYLIYKLTHWYTFDAGMAPLVVGMFFVGAVQLFCIGILGEYMSVLLRRTSVQSVVVEKETLNFDKEGEQ